MFTGLAETRGIIKKISKGSEKYDIWIESSAIAQDLKPGNSIAVDGVCQTVVTAGQSEFMVQAVEETLKKTTFSSFSGMGRQE